MPAANHGDMNHGVTEFYGAAAQAARRGRLLGRTRTISLGIAGGAVLASLGLGTAFAHAIPGHSSHPGGRPAPASAPRQAGGGGTPASPRPTATAGPRRHRHGSPRRVHHRARHIAPPPQTPAPTSSPPQVSSGGS